MILTREQAAELIKAPRNQVEIARAKVKRSRHQLHTEPEIDPGNLSEPHHRFLAWVKAILRSEDNYQRFRELYRPPIFTNELVEDIFSEFERVFEARNAYEKFHFESPELEADAQEYRKKIGDLTFWETQGFEHFKNSIDDLIVVDLPRIDPERPPQDSDRPAPYYYLLDIDNLIDVVNTRVKGVDPDTGEGVHFFKTEYVIFKGEGSIVYVFDDEHYRIFNYEDGTVEFLEEHRHSLGYCPARSFWTTPLNSKCTIQKRSPITNSISEMDWLLFFSVARKYLELYAPFPVYAVYRGKCDYKVEANGRRGRCADGHMIYDGEPIAAEGKRERCPVCSNRLKVGPGNVIELRVPKDKEDPDLMANPMKVIPAESTSLEYMRQAIREKYDEIFHKCVGRGADPQNKQAQNELQIRAGFESRTAVLLKIKRNFEIAHSFALDTVFRLRYGQDYKGLTLSYGDEFFVKDEQTQTAELEAAIDNGAPGYEIASRRAQIMEARYKNNPEELERMTILRHLEPFAGMDLAAVLDLRAKAADLVPREDLIIKANFVSFIDRFEREQTNVVNYARKQEFTAKIEGIREELIKYARERMAETTPPGPEPEPEPEPAPPVPPAPEV